MIDNERPYMRTRDRFEFDAIPHHLREGMMAASQSLLKGRRKTVTALLGIALTTLTAFGAMAIAVFIAHAWAIDATWFAMLGLLAGGGLYIGSQNLLYNEMTQETCQRALHCAPQALVFDDAGVTYEAGSATWFTPWAMIDDVFETRKTITISTAGIALVLPKDAVGDAALVDRLIEDLKAQIANA